MRLAGGRAAPVGAPSGSEGQTPSDVYPLLLGMEWFTDLPGGLNRYFADLLAALEEDGGPGPVAVALGPAEAAPACVHPASSLDASLRERVVGFGRKAEQLAAAADVVDGHFALYTAAALAFRRTRARPLVVHFQGPWAAESRSQGSRGVGDRVKGAIERRVYGRADAVVTLSRAWARMAVEEYGVSPWNVRVIPPAVDLSRFTPGDRRVARANLDLPDDAFVIGAVRRLVPRMGLDVAVDALARLADDDALLVIAGDGPEADALASQAAARGVGDRVRLLGSVRDEDVVSLYRAADAVVVPTRALEGFGLVVVEALACGTPVIASDVGGLPDAMAGLSSDLLVPPDDADALAGRLTRVHRGDAAVPTAETCRAHAERFSRAALAANHRRLYADVAAGVDAPRVVLLTHTAEPSGAELALLGMVKALGDRIRPWVILGEDGPLREELAAAGIPHEVLPLGASGRLRRDHIGGASAAQLRAVGGTGAHVARLARRLRQLRPDLVHTNSLKAALYGGAAAKLASVPVVWHVHDRISDDYLPANAVKLVHAASRRLPAAVLANSEATLSTVPETTKIRRVVGNAIVAPETPPARPPGAPFTIGVVGRLTPWKGQATFLDAFAKAFPADDVRARLIGAALFGEDGYEAELREQADRLGIADRVEFRGHRRDVAEEYRALDVVVHSSVLPEPFGQVIVEAQAAGRPIVAAAAGGVLELIEDGVDGLLYPPGDADALAAHLRRLRAERETREALIDAGRVSARRFRPEQVAAQVFSAYQAILSESGRA